MFGLGRKGIYTSPYMRMSRMQAAITRIDVSMCDFYKSWLDEEEMKSIHHLICGCRECRLQLLWLCSLRYFQYLRDLFRQLQNHDLVSSGTQKPLSNIMSEKGVESILHFQCDCPIRNEESSTFGKFGLRFTQFSDICQKYGLVPLENQCKFIRIGGTF